ITFGQYVFSTHHLQYGTHCTAGDDTGTFRGRLHVDLGARVTTTDRILQSVAIQLHGYHVAFGLFHCFLNCKRNFTGFTATETHTTVAIANHSQSGKGENTTTFNHFGNPVHLNQLFLQFAFVTLYAFIICQDLYPSNSRPFRRAASARALTRPWYLKPGRSNASLVTPAAFARSAIS